VFKRVLVTEIVEPEPPRAEVVDVKEINAIFHDMDWTGKPPPIVVQTTEDTTKVEIPKTPIADILKVLVVQVDSTDPAGSKAYVKYIDPALQRRHNEPRERFLLRDQRLTGQYQNVRVVDITAGGVVFGFDEEGRAQETVPAAGYPDRQDIVVVGADGVIRPQQERLIPTKGDYVSPRLRVSREVRRNEFQIGTDTAKEIEENFSAILSRDLQYRQARNPGDGSIQGIQITKVKPDSLPAKHGITEGEIVKSINGHRVTSVNEAVAYVKKESDTTDTWVVVFEKQGREFTRTYKSPQE